MVENNSKKEITLETIAELIKASADETMGSVAKLVKASADEAMGSVAKLVKASADETMVSVTKLVKTSADETRSILEAKIDSKIDSAVDALAAMTQNHFLKLEAEIKDIKVNTEKLDVEVGEIKTNTEDIKAELNKKVDIFTHKDLEFRVEKLEEKNGISRLKAATV